MEQAEQHDGRGNSARRRRRRALFHGFGGVHIARKTPAELSQDLANNLRNFASLGGKPAESDGTKPDEPQLPPQFSHLGPGGIERSAFGGRDIADEDKAAIEAMVQKKGGGDDHWLDDDEGDGDDDNRWLRGRRETWDAMSR